jgi:membrane protease YdiL (CAAX protease family)
LKDLGKIVLFFAAAIALGAALAPALFQLGRGLPYFSGFEFEKYFTRSVVIAAVALIYPLVRWLRVPGWRDLGFRPDPRWRSNLGAGFAASFLPMVALGAVLLGLEVYRLKSEIPWGAFGRIALTAATVAALEESLFRGVFLSLVARSTGALAANLSTSALFSIIHFLKPPADTIPPESVRWSSGFELIPAVFHQFGQPMLLLGGFATLFAVGATLAFATQRSGSLWLAIGLHAGWVLGPMGFSKMTKRINRDTLPWVGPSLAVGIAALICVAATFVAVTLYLRRHARTAPAIHR